MTKESESNDLVLLPNDGAEVSFQIFQDVYNTVTGRTERIIRFYFENFHVGLSEFENLHALIEQMMEQYHCRISSLCITVRYSDSRNERFSSFERFRLQCGSRSAVVENIEFEYDFLIVLPKTREAKKYRAEIFLISGVGVEDKLDRNRADQTERRMARSYTKSCGRVDIDYVDLAVARNIEGQLDEWFSSLPKVRTGWFSRVSGTLSQALDFPARLLSFSLLLLGAMLFLQPRVVDFETAFRALAVLITSGFVIAALTSRISFWASGKFGKLRPKSIIELSKSDSDKLKELDGVWIESWLTFLATAIFSGLVGLALTALAAEYGFSPGP